MTRKKKFQKKNQQLDGNVMNVQIMILHRTPFGKFFQTNIAFKLRLDTAFVFDMKIQTSLMSISFAAIFRTIEPLRTRI